MERSMLWTGRIVLICGGEVFAPCREIWEPMSSPVPSLDGLPAATCPYFALPLALDDDGTGVSRKVLLLASTTRRDFYVYDVTAKCWIDPSPKLSSNFSYKFSRHGIVLSPPLLVGNTVYWFTTTLFLYAYDLELKQCFGTFLLFPLVNPLPSTTYNSFFLHLGGEKFCFLSAVGPYLHLYKLGFSRNLPRAQSSGRFPGPTSHLSEWDLREWCRRDAVAEVEGEGCRKAAPIVLLGGGITLDGKLPGDLLRGQLGQIVTHLDSSIQDKHPLLPNTAMPRFQRLYTFDSRDPESGGRARFNSSDPEFGGRARSI